MDVSKMLAGMSMPLARPVHTPLAPRQPRSQRLRAASTEEGEPEASKARRPSPLERGGTLQGDLAAGKDAGAAARSATSGKDTASKVVCRIADGKFSDFRWIDGRWDFSQFADGQGNTDWDAVIDAEMARRRLLEDTPVDSLREDPVQFDTAEIPWWAWVRRFHLPEAEKLNGRAAMVGYGLAWIVDSLSGAGLVDQQNSFLGKLLLHVAVFGILIFRNADVLPKYKNLLDEATFYDKQWGATWEGQKRPSETES